MPKTTVYVLNGYSMMSLIEGLSLPEIDRKENGAPYFVGGNQFVSISHKDRYVVVAISDDQVGVDIEAIKERPSCFKLANAYFGEKIRKGDYLAFYTSWTKKEALGKFFEIGVNKEILAIDSSGYNLSYKGRDLSFVTQRRNDIIISVCETTHNVEFVWIDRVQAEKRKNNL